MDKRIVMLIMTSFFMLPQMWAQVGINTDVPQEDLEIKGDLRVKEDLKVWSEDTQRLNAGEKNQYFVSQGKDRPPRWETIPDIYWKLQQSIIKAGQSDDTHYTFKTEPIRDLSYGYLHFKDDGSVDGILYEDLDDLSEGEPIALVENSPLELPWHELKGYTSEIIVKKADSKIGINFQTILQTATVSLFSAKVAVGVFLDGKLKSVRDYPVGISGGYPYLIASLNDMLSGIYPKPDGTPYKIQIAVRLRYYRVDSSPKGEKYLFVGHSDPDLFYVKEGSNIDINTTSFMNRSNIVISIYEPVV